MQNAMTSRSRTETALSGGTPDRVPFFPIHDIGYVMRIQGKCVRDFRTATARRKSDYVANAFARHAHDGYFVHGLDNPGFATQHELVDIRADDMHVYKNLDTGELFMMNAVSDRYALDGTPMHMLDSTFESHITSRADIARLVRETPDRDFYGEYGYYGPLRALSAAHPDHHFAFQLSSPLPGALSRCGGYEAGMCLLAEDESLCTELLEAETELQIARIAPGVAAGGRSVFMTSYYTGADTIAPDTFRRVIAPLEARMMQAARDAGLYVIYWFLGDMTPLLDCFGTMPFDALAPEQPRKGYGTDYATLRAAFPGRCIFAHTIETQMVEYDRPGIVSCFDGQYKAAGQNGAFVAGVTITPEDAQPEAVDHYAEIVRGYAYP